MLKHSQILNLSQNLKINKYRIVDNTFLVIYVLLSRDKGLKIIQIYEVIKDIKIALFENKRNITSNPIFLVNKLQIDI